jgi:SAM-dependent methyltransferase
VYECATLAHARAGVPRIGNSDDGSDDLKDRKFASGAAEEEPATNDPAEVFQRIFRERRWHSQQSVSRWGSELGNTERIIRELPSLLQRHGVTSVLDVPCGDFSWMRHVDLGGLDYIGGDIVPELVTVNQRAFGSARRRFVQFDLLSDPLPESDLILCRDCLVHFSRGDVFRALTQFAKTSARFLLTTTFTYRSYPRNGDIETGSWTPINLETEPYGLAPPIALIVEGSHESIVYAEGYEVPMFDRCLGLWRMEDVRARLSRE